MKTSFSTLLLLFVLFSMKAQKKGSLLFSEVILHKIELFNVDTTNFSNVNFKGMYQPVSIKIDGHLLDSIGMATKGDKSFLAAPNNKKPFKIKINNYIKGQKYDGITRFNLNNNLYDPSFCAEKLTFDAAAKLGIPSPRIAYTEVYINTIYWGLYTLVEAQDEIYKRVFGNDKGPAMEAFNPSISLMYFGDAPNDYDGKYIVDNGDSTTAWPLWIKLLDKLTNTAAGSGYVDTISAYFDYLSFFKFTALLDYNLNGEDKGKNAIYYYDYSTRKWYSLCWDQNAAFPTSDLNYPANAIFVNTTKIAVVEDYYKYDSFFNTYNRSICQLKDSIFSASDITNRLPFYRKLIDTAVKRDIRKGFEYTSYEETFPRLIDFINRRNTAAKLFLDAANVSCNSLIDIDVAGKTIFQIFPNPATDKLIVRQNNAAIIEYVIYDLFGRIVKEGKLNNSEISVSELSTGIYIIKCIADHKLTGMQRFGKL